ncbi:MAG: hypothetical protein AAFW69_10545 [Pseudomonadota bacterium]
MELSLTREIAVPEGWLRARVEGIDAHLPAAAARGWEIARVAGTSVAPGSSWTASGRIRGRRVRGRVEITGADAEGWRFRGGGEGFALTGRIGTEALGPRKTRLTLEVALRPETLTARMMMPSLRLFRPRIARRIEAALRRLARRLRRDWRAEAEPQAQGRSRRNSAAG